MHATTVWADGRAPLASQIVQACINAHPAFAMALPQALPENENQALARVAVALVRAGIAIKRPLVLVFDNLHHLPDLSVLQGLQPLLDYSPPKIQCVFASRSPLPLSLGRLREHQQLLEMEACDLRFTSAESEALWELWLGTREFSSTQTLRQGWHDSSAGWAMAVASIGRALKSGLAPQACLDESFDFLDSDVMADLSAAHRRTLKRLSCIDTFDAQLVSLIGNRSALDCSAFLEKFSATGFLAHSQINGIDGWQLHPTLQRRLSQLLARESLSVRRKVHRIASKHLAERGQLFDAVQHAVAADDPARAAELVESQASSLFKSGQHEQLAALVRLVPPSSSVQHPRLRLWVTLLALMEHRFVDCEAMLTELEHDAGRHDGSTRRRMRVVRCWLAVFLDDMEAAARLLTAKPTESDPGFDEITLAAERNVLSWIHIYRNDYERAREVQTAVSRNTSETPRGTLFGTLTGRCMAGLSHALEGRMDAAERTYRKVLEACHPNGELDPACADAAALATGLLGETLYEINDLAGVLALEPRLLEIKHRSLPDTLLRVMLAICRAHALHGQLDAALRVAIDLQDHAEASSLDRLMSYALLEQLRLHLLQHDPISAQIAWDRLTHLSSGHVTLESSTLSEIAVVAGRAEILVHMYHGRFDIARTHIAALLAICQHRGRHRRVATLHFQHALMDRELGAQESAASHVLAGLQLGSRLGLVRSLLDAHPDVPELLTDSFLGEPDAMLEFHADRLRAAAGFGPLHKSSLNAAISPAASVAHCAKPALSSREKEIMGLLAQAFPNKEIARELGLSAETVKWHLSNIYAKLGVGTRYQALALLRGEAR